MAFSHNDQNPLPNLVELRSRLVPATEMDVALELKVELRVHPHEIDDEIGTISVGIQEAVLSIQPTGMDIVPKTKLGQPVAPVKAKEVTRETTSSHSTTVEGSTKGALGMKAGPLGPGLAFNLEGGEGHKFQEALSRKETESISTSHLPVRAIGNNNWSIRNENGETLDAVYIDYETLCHLIPIWGSNLSAVTAEVVARQKNLKISLQPNSLFSVFNNNQKKLASVIAAKALHSATSSSHYQGLLVFSRSELHDEG